MEKVYSLKRLTGQVKRFAALVLVALLAVGNVFAQYDGTGTFTKINSESELTTGYYVVANQTGAFAMKNEASGTKYIYSTDAVFTNPAANIVWYISVSETSLTIYNETAQVYAACNGSKNSACLQTDLNDNARWTATLDNNGNWLFINVGTSGGYCNLSYNSGSPRFACYNNTGLQQLSLYKLNDGGDTPVIVVTPPTISVPTGTYYTEQTVTLTAEEGANIYYSLNDGEPILYTGPFTVNETSTITAYAEVGETHSDNTSVTLTFPVQVANIAAYYATENANLFNITGDLTFVYRSGRYMYVKDETGGLLVYDNSNPVITTSYNEGDVFSNGLVGTRSVYNGLDEIIPTMNTAEGVAGEAVTPIEVTVAELLANTDQYMSQLVVLKNGIFNGGVLNNNKNPKKFTQNGSDIVIYNRFNHLNNADMPEEMSATVVGFVSVYGSTVQLFPRDVNDIIPLTITEPYNCDFEGNNIYVWNFANGENANKWFIGQAQGFDDNKLYISASNGAANNYNVNTAAVSHAYVAVSLPAEDVMLTFDCRTVGNAHDYLLVSVLDEAPVAGTQPETYLARIYGVNDFTTQSVLIPASYAGAKNLVFTWVNDNIIGSQTPAAIDNVMLKNTYTVNATVSNLYETEYNDNAIGATYAPNHDVVGHGDAHTGIISVADHYHINSVTVNGLDVTSSLVSIGNHQYKLTLDPVYENKNVNVVVGLDSAYVFIYVLGGEGTVNNELVVDSETELPAMYSVTLPGNSSLPCTFTPAQGFHVSSLIINNDEYPNVENYNLEHLFSNHLVLVTFAPNHYVVSTVAYGNGEVSESEEFDYDPENTYLFTATPATGYRIATLKRNNVVVDVPNPALGYTETLTNILQDYNYEVMFEQNTYSLTTSCGPNGTISPNGVSNYNYHQSPEVVITADYGYYISSVIYDGFAYELPENDQITSLTIPFINIEANHTVSATFAEITYNVTVNAGTHGTITPGTGSFAYGSTPTFAITPDPGYSIADVTVDGVSVGAVSQYTFLPLKGNHTIAATFSAVTFTITATAGNGGTISNEGVSQVAYNGNKSYTITANTGYHVSDVVVDGTSVGVVNTYNFTNVMADHSIYVEFAVNEYTVSVISQPNVTVNPGTVTVQHGATPVFAIIPDYGYRVSQIQVNGTNVNLSNVPNENEVYTYTFAAVTANQTIKAVVERKTYTITASAGNNGTITPNGSTSVNHGDAKSFAFAPADGYVIDNVTVDGMSLGALTAYTFTNVVANHSINVTFKPIECMAPYSLYTTHIDSTSAILHWSHPIATSFNIQYKTLNGTWTSVSNMSGNSYLLTELDPNTTYLWQVRANCSTSNLSEWSDKISFKTLHALDITGVEDLVKNQVKVYGEHQNVHILNNEGVNIENVRIFDAYGKLIYSGAVNTAHEVINLNVAAGAYIVNIATDNGIANYKVVLMK
jgi:hypothetical protein